MATSKRIADRKRAAWVLTSRRRELIVMWRTGQIQPGASA